jgi:hypothetical protein
MTIYEVSCRPPERCGDGRSTAGLWGHERQYHATRASAEAACAHLRDSEYWGRADPPEYSVRERTRADFAPDAIGEGEWRAACRQAGVAPTAADSVATH